MIWCDSFNDLKQKQSLPKNASSINTQFYFFFFFASITFFFYFLVLHIQNMPYTIDDVIYKLNQISNENEQFRQEMQRNNAEIIQELRCEINSLKNELGASRNRKIAYTSK